MDTISINNFRDNLDNAVKEVVNHHKPLKVTRRAGDAFVVISAEDWGRARNAPRIAKQQPYAANCPLT